MSFSSSDSSLIWIIELFETPFPGFLTDSSPFSFLTNLFNHLLRQFWGVLVEVAQFSKHKTKSQVIPNPAGRARTPAWLALDLALQSVHCTCPSVQAQRRNQRADPVNYLLTRTKHSATEGAGRVGRSHAWLWPLQSLVAQTMLEDCWGTQRHRVGIRQALFWLQGTTVLLLNSENLN